MLRRRSRGATRLTLGGMTESTHLRLGLAQIDPTVGDLEGNVALISDSIGRAPRGRCTARAASRAVRVGIPTGGPPASPGLPRRRAARASTASRPDRRGSLRSSASPSGSRLGHRAGRLRSPIDPPPPRPTTRWRSCPAARSMGIYRKCHLPNYGVFDERRYFEPGTEPALIEVDGALIGLTVCEDIWVRASPRPRRRPPGRSWWSTPPPRPTTAGRGCRAESMVAERARVDGVAFALCNAVGGQDELVFDGGSVVVAPDGETLARAAQFEAELLLCDLPLPAPDRALARRRGTARPCRSCEARVRGPTEARLEPRLTDADRREEGEVYAALVSACATTSPRTASSTSSSASRAGSTPRSSPWSPPTPSAPTGSPWSSCPPPTPATRPNRTRGRSRRTSGIELIEISIAEAMQAYEAALARSFEGASPTSRRRTSRPGSGATW